MGTRTATRLAWSMWGLSIALIAVGSVLHFENRPIELWSYITNDLLVILPFATVGALIASRRPEHPIGWMFCAGTSLLALEAPTVEYAIYALITAPGSLPGGLGVAWFASWFVILVLGFLLSFVLLFPSGRLPSPRWRPILWLWISYLILAVLTWAFKPGPLPAIPAVNNPLGIERAATVLKTLNDLLSGPLFLTFWAAFVLSMITRFRRAKGEERQQLKWFAYACALVIVWAGAYTLFQFLHIPLNQSVISLLWGLAFAGLPISVGIGILKYHLYDIDIIINRTLVYGVLTACVVGLYVLIVGGLGTLLQTQNSLIGTVIAILLIIFLFQPLRQRLQKIANRFVPVPQAINRESIATAPSQTKQEQKVVAAESAPDTTSRSHWLAWMMWAISVLLFIGYFALRGAVSVASSSPETTNLLYPIEQSQVPLLDFVGDIFLHLGYLAFSTLGVLIVARHPENRMGWIFCTIGLIQAVSEFASYYAIYALVIAPGSLPGGLAAGWLQNWMLVLSFGLLFVFLPLLFPNGRLSSRHGRTVGWLGAVAIAVLSFWQAFNPGPLVTTALASLSDPLGAFSNPLGISAVGSLRAVVAVVGIASGLLLAAAIAATTSLILRLRRAIGDERQQIKWFAYMATLLIVLYIVVFLAKVLYLSVPSFYAIGMSAIVVGRIVTMIIAFLGLPLAAGIAILKYRLYDVDIIINRTLVYGALIVIILGLYVLVVGMASMLFQSVGNSLLAILATGLIAVLFHPLRQRLQRAVNRLMYGERHDPYAALSRLGRRLEATLAPGAVLPTVVTTVREVLKLPYVAIYLKQDHDGNKIAAESASPLLHSEGGRIRVPGMERQGLCIPLIHQGETLGYIVLGPRAPNEAFSSTDLRLLDDLAPQVGVAVHAVRLTADLQRSRERLVMAREEERRRLRRDLHDGLGPQLAGLTLKLETARNRLADDPLADSLLTDLAKRTQDATADIRRLVYELRPPTLDELGLVAALREGAAQYSQQGLNSVHITIDAPESLPPLPAAVEVAVYRITQEALTNVVHHAEAHVCNVRITLDEQRSWLCLEIHDDGRGLSSPRRAGVGLSSMRERAEELGGTWTIESLHTGGTRILVRLPCGLASTIPDEE